MSIRIGIEAQRVFRKHKHGMDIVVLELIRQIQLLQPEGYQFVVFVKPDADECLTSSPNVEIVKLSSVTYPFWEQVVLPAAVQKHKIDLLHCTSNTAPLDAGVPTVLTLHDIIYLESGGTRGATWYQKMGQIYRKLIVPRIVPRSKCVITVSDYEKEIILSHFGRDLPVRVVHNGISEDFGKPISETKRVMTAGKYGLPDRFILFLGNTDPKKNLQNVLKACMLLINQTDSDLKVVIADYDEDRLLRHLKKAGRLDIRDRFMLPGYISNQDLPAVLEQASVFLYPSLRESFGIPLLEAQACGVPVVTSSVSAIPEVAGEGASFINPESPDEIAQAVLEILQDQKLSDALVLAGRENAAKFSWKKTAKKTLEIYADVLQEL